MLKRVRTALSYHVHKALGLLFSENEREYSVERVFAFHEYCQRASYWRVAFVLVFNLSLPLLVLFGLDSIPMQDPRASWSGNVSFWMRTFVNAIFVCGGIMVQAPLVIPDVNITLKNGFVIVTGVCFVYTGSLMLLAKLWVFPVPFTFTVGGIPFCSGMLGFAVLVLGTKDRTQLRRFFFFTCNIGLQTSMMFVYPSYNAIFLTLKGPAQLAFVLILPVIKFGFKYLIVKVQSANDDLVPAILSSVDIFDALYMTKCMQSAGTIMVGLGIIAVDLAHNMHAMVGLARQTRELRAMYVSQALHGVSNKSARALSQQQAGNLKYHRPSILFARLMYISKGLDANSARDPQEQLRRLQLDTASRRFASNDKHKQVHHYTKKHVAVAPLEQPKADFTHQPSEPGASENSETRIFTESVRLLHESEAVAVIEYIETVVPVFYALYISILFHLPNAQYYQDMKELTAERLHHVMANILLYAFMELLSLLGMHWMLKRSFGVSMLHQLAFAMENEWRLFQCNFVSWILVVFQFLLIHNGSDYSFQFKWIHGEW